MKAAIIIDAWKEPIFKRHLTQSGYTYNVAFSMEECLLLQVSTENLEALAIVIKAANSEAAQTGN